MKKAILSAILVIVAGCTDGFTTFPVTEDAQETIDENISIVRLDESNIASFSKRLKGPQRSSLGASSNWEYLLGAGDVLAITVFDHPELTPPSTSDNNGSVGGFTIQADGSFYYPFIGDVQAARRSAQAVRAELATRMAEYIPDPQIDLRVAEFNSQRAIVSGEVENPNTQILNVVPLTLLAAINAAGGLTESADPSRITLQRGGRIANVDLTGFLERGYKQNNPVLRHGDIVNIPERRTLEAYMLGEIADPDTIDLSLETVTLTQALARKGGLKEVRADARGVFVFRSKDVGMTVFQLETSSPTGLLLGTKFVLEPGDVIYVTRSPLQRWNDTISRLLPSVSAIDATNTLLN